MLTKIVKSHLPSKKWDAVFLIDGKQRIIPFGQNGAQDLTIHKNESRAVSYRKRHAKDNLNNPLSPGALSYYILWSSQLFIFMQHQIIC